MLSTARRKTLPPCRPLSWAVGLRGVQRHGAGQRCCGCAEDQPATTTNQPGAVATDHLVVYIAEGPGRRDDAWPHALHRLKRNAPEAANDRQVSPH